LGAVDHEPSYVLNVDNDVESCGVSPRVKLKLIGLDSSLHA
jgi:hypothetical protein